MCKFRKKICIASKWHTCQSRDVFSELCQNKRKIRFCYIIFKIRNFVSILRVFQAISSFFVKKIFVLKCCYEIKLILLKQNCAVGLEVSQVCLCFVRDHIFWSDVWEHDENRQWTVWASRTNRYNHRRDRRPGAALQLLFGQRDRFQLTPDHFWHPSTKYPVFTY